MTQQIVFDYQEPPPKAFREPSDFKPIETYPELTGYVAMDFETKDPGIGANNGSSWPFFQEGKVCGASFAWIDPASSQMKSFYVGIGHASGNSDPYKFTRWLRDHYQKPDVTFVMANAGYDLGWAERLGVRDPANLPIDIQGMEALIDENRLSYSLDALARDHLGKAKSTAALVERCRAGGISHPMSNMDKIPTFVAAPYGRDDAELTLGVFLRRFPLIAEQGLEKAFELERECILVSRDLRRRGVRVDLDYFERLKLEFIQRRDDALAQVRAITGVAISPWDNEGIARALKAENSAVVLERTATGRESVRAAALEALATPVASAVLEARQLDKSISTFLEGYIEKHQRNGRIHCEFHALRRTTDEGDNNGTVSYRFSSSNPNLQNIPIRTGDGARIRQGFVPEEGEQWGKLDWASQEPRLTVHYAHLARLEGAAAMVARYAADPMTDLHGEAATLMGIKRGPAKAINLGITYGMQGARLCHELGLPTKFIEKYGRTIEVAGDEGQDLLRRHHQAVPFIKGLYDLAKDTADKRGYVILIDGRRARFTQSSEGRYMWTHKALNRLVQGSAAIQMKMALVAARKAGIPVLLTVHDEMGLSLPEGFEGYQRLAEVGQIMETVLPLSVPVIAETKVADNWGNAK